jgi:hypothetical protein
VRKALNENPVVQIAVLAALAIVVAFFLLTRVMGKSDESTSATTTPTTATGAPAAPAPTGTATTPGAASGAAPSTAAPPSTAPVAPAAGASGAVSAKFVAGPGLPKPVVSAYDDGKAIVLLVIRHRGIDDTAVRASVERLRGRSDLAVFVTRAGHIARYARITEGVDVNRVPALIVVRPRRLNNGVPKATVSYGFRSADSVQQAVRDALYKGPTNLPYYPR